MKNEEFLLKFTEVIEESGYVSDQNIISETQPQETDSSTAENLCKALELARRLKAAIINIDPNIQRA